MSSNYSTNSQKLVQLNRELPFVKAVFDVIEGRSDLDTAVHILKQEEQAHGVFIRYNEFHALWGLTLIPKQQPIDATQMLALARNDWDKFMENYVEVDASALNALNNFQLKLNRFLDATSLVLQGAEFANECLVTLDNGSIWTFSFREWGEYLFMKKYRCLCLQHLPTLNLAVELLRLIRPSATKFNPHFRFSVIPVKCSRFVDFGYHYHNSCSHSDRSICTTTIP